jgi:3-methyladenine DNA glycosylase AlkD
LLNNPDPKLRRQVCSCLSQIAKHTVDLVETVVDAEIFPNVLLCLKDKDEHVKKNTATLICEIAKHTPELAQLIVNSGGIAAIVDYIKESTGNNRLPAVMTVGYVAAFSETLALTVILAKGVVPLAQALESESEEHIKAACAWALGQIGKHSPDHAKTLADHAVLSKLLHVLQESSEKEDQDLKTKTKRALKYILEKTLHMEALEPLLQVTTPRNILKYVAGQFSKILSQNVQARKFFVTCGGLKRCQEIANTFTELQGSKLGESIRLINECYPEEIVRYYSPGYSNTLLDKVVNFLKKIEEYKKEPMKPEQPVVIPV